MRVRITELDFDEPVPPEHEVRDDFFFQRTHDLPEEVLEELQEDLPQVDRDRIVSKYLMLEVVGFPMAACITELKWQEVTD